LICLYKKYFSTKRGKFSTIWE